MKAAPVPPQQGFVLVAVLWLIALLTVLATGLAWTSRQDQRAAQALLTATQARYLADSATQLILLNLLSRDESTRLLADDEQVSLELPGGHAEVVVSDEHGRIDLNAANAALLGRLLGSAGLDDTAAATLAAAILDYRDENDTRRLNGAEDDDYAAAGLPWGARDERLRDVRELRRVLGMEEWIYAAIEPLVTVHTGAAEVTPAVASLPVLLAISNENQTIDVLEDYIAQRRQNHRDGLPLPRAPGVLTQFTDDERGSIYTLAAKVRTPQGREAGVITTVRVIRSPAGNALELLAQQPWYPPPVAVDG